MMPRPRLHCDGIVPLTTILPWLAHQGERLLIVEQDESASIEADIHHNGHWLYQLYTQLMETHEHLQAIIRYRIPVVETWARPMPPLVGSG